MHKLLSITELDRYHCFSDGQEYEYEQEYEYVHGNRVHQTVCSSENRTLLIATRSVQVMYMIVHGERVHGTTVCSSEHRTLEIASEKLESGQSEQELGCAHCPPVKTGTASLHRNQSS